MRYGTSHIHISFLIVPISSFPRWYNPMVMALIFSPEVDNTASILQSVNGESALWSIAMCRILPGTGSLWLWKYLETCMSLMKCATHRWPFTGLKNRLSIPIWRGSAYINDYYSSTAYQQWISEYGGILQQLPGLKWGCCRCSLHRHSLDQRSSQ